MIPYGYCQCGCGGRAPLAKYSRKETGWVKGQPVRFIQYHRRRRREALPTSTIMRRERHDEGSPPRTQPGKRTCLRCSRPFQSWDVRLNRLCKVCSAYNDQNSVEPIRGKIGRGLRER